jgi:hypothetical protein
MSIFVLKMIAIITMLIDHTGAILIPYDSPYYWPFRMIGRIAFPIFVFMLVEGFNHTSNIRKYLTRMGIFALISEIPFDVAFYRSFYGGDILADVKGAFTDPATLDLLIKRLFSHQNVFFTLFLGLLAIYLMSMVEKRFRKEIFLCNLFDGLITLGMCFIAAFLKTDYGFAGVLLIVAFYLFRGSKILVTICFLIIIGTFFRNSIEILAILAMIPIAFYNGKKGKNIKYIFYIFYPAHLLLLWLISLAF